MAMLGRLKMVALIGVVGAAALLPLYGDPRNAAVTHAEWARMVLRGLGMEDAVAQSATAAQAFATLSWKNSLSFRADRYVSSGDVRVEGQGETRQVVPTGDVGEVTYAVAVVRAGDYRLRVRMAGSPERPASAELARVGEVKPVDAFTVRPKPEMTWMDAGAAHLDRGAYTASVLLPRGAVLEHVEVAPPCIVPVEPPGGWRAPAVLLSEHAAVTMVQALDRQSELPPADAPIELDASAFHTDSGAVPVSATGAPLAPMLEGGVNGIRALIVVDLPEAGLYTISAFGLRGAGQSWTADSCLKSVVCADKEGRPDVMEWRPALTAPFAAGRHAFSVLLAPGAAIQRVRAERKKDSPADHVAMLRRLGFDVGPPGPMPRARAVDAMHFLEKKAAEMQAADCGDIVLPTPPATTRAALDLAPIPGPATGPDSSVGSGQPAVAPGIPVLPPQDVSTPVQPGVAASPGP
jgi:hypothetical protein